jgi:hypothetical protein
MPRDYRQSLPGQPEPLSRERLTGFVVNNGAILPRILSCSAQDFNSPFEYDGLGLRT